MECELKKKALVDFIQCAFYLNILIIIILMWVSCSGNLRFRRLKQLTNKAWAISTMKTDSILDIMKLLQMNFLINCVSTYFFYYSIYSLCLVLLIYLFADNYVHMLNRH
jgi:hypothetical protein